MEPNARTHGSHVALYADLKARLPVVEVIDGCGLKGHRGSAGRCICPHEDK